MNELILIGSMQFWDMALFSFNKERKQMLVCNRQKKGKLGKLKYLHVFKLLNNQRKRENNAAL